MKTFEEQLLLEKPENSESKESLYHFEEMAEIEPAAIKLVRRLKESIEKGKYDALISDDAGGRIPTLLIRKIMRKIRPDMKVPTLFVKGGFSTPGRSLYRGNWDMGREMEQEMEQRKELNMTDQQLTEAHESKRKWEEKSEKDQQKLLDYLKEFKDRFHPKNPLLVTQFIRTGASIRALSEALHKAGLAAGVVTLTQEGNGPHHEISEEHEKLSGVEGKSGEYSPIPSATRKREHPLLSRSERKILKQELDKKYYGNKYNDYYRDVFLGTKK